MHDDYGSAFGSLAFYSGNRGVGNRAGICLHMGFYYDNGLCAKSITVLAKDAYVSLLNDIKGHTHLQSISKNKSKQLSEVSPELQCDAKYSTIVNLPTWRHL
jgi:hypothetical protein